MKSLSKFTLLLSTCVVLTACNSGSTSGGNQTPVTPQGQKTVLYSFAGGTTDGAVPKAELIQGSDGNFYGTTQYGGNSGLTPSGLNVGYGTIFKLTPQGQYTLLYKFTGAPDGANPLAGLIQGSDGNFYGTTSLGGNGSGTVFKITLQGVESPIYTSLYSFKGRKNQNDGAYPSAELLQGSDGNFYGTTVFGGNFESSRFESGGRGTVFRITPLGVESPIYRFAGGTDGTFPWAGLIQASDGNGILPKFRTHS